MIGGASGDVTPRHASTREATTGRQPAMWLTSTLVPFRKNRLTIFIAVGLRETGFTRGEKLVEQICRTTKNSGFVGLVILFDGLGRYVHFMVQYVVVF